MDNDISLPFITLLIPAGLLLSIYMIRGVVKGSVNPWYLSGGKPCNHKENPFMFWTYVSGGLLMGFGTRLSNGCNVGALYTPIANFSFSGWIFLAALVTGGVLGNKTARVIK